MSKHCSNMHIYAIVCCVYLSEKSERKMKRERERFNASKNNNNNNNATLLH